MTPEVHTAESVPTIAQRLERIERLLLLSLKSVLSLDEAAFYLNRSKARLYNLLSERALPHYKRGSRIYFRREELDAWLTENRVASTAEVDADAAAYILRKDAQRFTH